MLETPFMRLAPLIKDLANSLDDALDRPFALFGHSMGGIIGFELARALRDRGGPQTAHLFISAASAPGTPRTRPLIHCATAEEVKKELRALNGTPQALLENEEIMELMLPTLKADFSVLETYEYREKPPLAVPITIFGGTSDRVVPPAALNGWRRQSSRESRLQLFPGDHFFLNTAMFDLVRAITHVLDLETCAATLRWGNDHDLHSNGRYPRQSVGAG
jgi:surfactin synthase thioesterase subunit